MFNKLKNTFLGRNRMSKKEKEQVSYFLQYEYKFPKKDADSLVESGEYRKILETYNA